MRFYVLLLALGSIALLTGCATDPETQQAWQNLGRSMQEMGATMQRSYSPPPQSYEPTPPPYQGLESWGVGPGAPNGGFVPRNGCIVQYRNGEYVCR
jgi:hypothetical protein